MNILIKVVEAGLLLGMVWVVVGMFTTPTVKTPVNSQSPVSTTETVASFDVNKIIKAELFGKTKAIKPILPKGPAVAPALAHSIRLKGTVLAGERSVALIQPKANGKVDVFHVGDQIMPGISLRRIEKLRILIEVNGRRQAVMLEGSMNSLANTSTTSVPSMMGAQPTAATSAASAQPAARTLSSPGNSILGAQPEATAQPMATRRSRP